MNHREVLGVAANASPEDIQAAFRREALKNHPDVSASPEAAEAFMRIKAARDALMSEASSPDRKTMHDSVQRATDNAIKTTTAAAYTYTQDNSQTAAQQQTSAYGLFIDDIYAGMTPEEIAYIQELDLLARKKHSRFSFERESNEVRRHRRRLKTGDDRLSGKY